MVSLSLEMCGSEKRKLYSLLVLVFDEEMRSIVLLLCMLEERGVVNRGGWVFSLDIFFSLRRISF